MIDDKFIAELEGILPLVYEDSLSYYEVLEKVTYLLNECIQKVNNIADPVIYTPEVNEDGTISWTNNGGLPNPEPVDITGPIGPAPTISVTDIPGGHRITIIDEDHPDGINIDVMNGAKGEQGDDGVSPNITITDITGGHRVTITDKEHPQGQSFNIMNGAKGEQGDAGVSPTVSITDITGGHRITITDAAHPQGQNFDVMNGEKGDTGAGVPTGGSADDILAKNSSANYDTKWTKTPVQMGSIATIETSPATAAHAIGDYIVYNGQLYTVISAIATGQTLAVGTNISSVSGGGLNDLRNNLFVTRFLTSEAITLETNGVGQFEISVPNIPQYQPFSIGQIYILGELSNAAAFNRGFQLQPNRVLLGVRNMTSASRTWSCGCTVIYKHI